MPLHSARGCCRGFCYRRGKNGTKAYPALIPALQEISFCNIDVAPRHTQVSLKRLEALLVFLEDQVELVDIKGLLGGQVGQPNDDQHGLLFRALTVIGHRKHQGLENLVIGTSNGRGLLEVFLGPEHGVLEGREDWSIKVT